jgi:hypothetical protein
MGGTSAHLSASQPVSPPGHLQPPAALAAPDQLRAKSGLKPQEYSRPVLGLNFLHFAAQRASLEKARVSEQELLCLLIKTRT